MCFAKSQKNIGQSGVLSPTFREAQIPRPVGLVFLIGDDNLANRLPWFKHCAMAHDDDVIDAGIRRFGLAGYGAYFVILELLHNDGIGNILLIRKPRLCQKLRSKWPKVCQYLDFYQESAKVQWGLCGQEVRIEVNKFREYQHNLSVKSKSKVNQNRLEGEGEGEGDKDLVPGPKPARKVIAKNGATRKTKNPPEQLRDIVSLYLQISGKGGSDFAKDPGGWARWMLEADSLLSELGGRVDLADECLRERATEWATLSDWTLAAVARRAKDWLAKKQTEFRNAVRQ